TGTLTDTDVDNPANTFTAVSTATASDNAYGSYTMTAAGVWSYTLNNSNATVQALNNGGTLSDTFTVTTVDGTAQQITITIHGAKDRKGVGEETTGTVTEAGAVDKDTPGAARGTGKRNDNNEDNTTTTINTETTA